MQTKFNLYPKEQLPENFKFPQSYIDLSSNMEKINELEYFPWWFEDPDYENSEIEDSVYLYSKAIEKPPPTPKEYIFLGLSDIVLEKPLQT